LHFVCNRTIHEHPPWRVSFVHHSAGSWSALEPIGAHKSGLSTDGRHIFVREEHLVDIHPPWPKLPGLELVGKLKGLLLDLHLHTGAGGTREKVLDKMLAERDLERQEAPMPKLLGEGS